MRALPDLLPKLTLVALLAVPGCEKPGPRPSDTDVAAYVAQSEPGYVRVGQVTTSYTKADKSLPPGSWRIEVHYVLHAQHDLYSPTPETRAFRGNFDRTVARVEEYRLPRIAAVQQLGDKAGLLARGANTPEPAVELQLVNRRDADLPDRVTLLAQPAGAGWNFVQLDAQALADDAVGAPLDEIRRASPTTVFVIAGTPEARDYADRARRFLDILNRAPKPE